MHLISERPSMITIDPETGFSVRCDALKIAAEACFDDVFGDEPCGEGVGDPERLRVRLRPCYRRARHVVRECGLAVRVGPRRTRR